MPPPSGRSRLFATLRWIAGAQSFYDAPDARDGERVREQGWVVLVNGRPTLTDEGRELMAELTDGRESIDALRLALTTEATYREAKRILELCGDIATATAWIVARQSDGRPMLPEESSET